MKIQDKSSAVFKLDDNGYLVTTAKLARVGAMQYLGEEIGRDSGKVYDVYVEPEELFNDETIQSFEGKTVTSNHPEEMEVNASNWKELAVGHIRNVRQDGEFLIGDVIVNDSKTIKDIQSGKIELSLGYDADLVDADGKIKKANIKGNHLAIVDEGRCGEQCKLGDGKPTIMSKLIKRIFGDKKAKINAKIAAKTKRLIDAKGELKQKLVDLEELNASDAPIEEKAAASEELTTEANDLLVEVTEVLDEIADLSADIQEEAPAETTANDELTTEESEKMASLEAENQELKDKIAELEEQLEAEKEKEAQATTANDIKRVFGDSVAIKNTMSSTDMKRQTLVHVGAKTKENVKLLNDCALTNTFETALIVADASNKKKPNPIGSKFVANDSKAQTKQLPKALRGNK